MSFFEIIEFENKDFSNDLFDKDFYEAIVKHHTKILRTPLKNIYEEIKVWPQEERSSFIQRILESNNIENICNRKIKPLTIDEIPEKLKNNKSIDIKKLFTDLYEQVLKGKNTERIYGSLQSHFSTLRKHPNDFLKCPICGLESLKT